MLSLRMGLFAAGLFLASPLMAQTTSNNIYVKCRPDSGYIFGYDYYKIDMKINTIFELSKVYGWSKKCDTSENWDVYIRGIHEIDKCIIDDNFFWYKTEGRNADSEKLISKESIEIDRKTGKYIYNYNVFDIIKDYESGVCVKASLREMPPSEKKKF